MGEGKGWVGGERGRENCELVSQLPRLINLIVSSLPELIKINWMGEIQNIISVGLLFHHICFHLSCVYRSVQMKERRLFKTTEMQPYAVQLSSIRADKK